MVNAWSLLYEELNGTMDETYPIKENGMSEEFDKDLTFSSAGINTATDSDETPFKQNFLADNDDSVAHHFDFNMPEPESITLEIPEVTF